MKKYIYSILLLLFITPVTGLFSQHFSGNLETNANFFMRDSLLGAYGTPQYDHQLFGGESWLNLNYNNWGFDFGLRFDLFNNSNLINPNSSYTNLGIGYWHINKEIGDLDITAGYIYDQIGSGIIYRAYEERALAIDNALVGLRLKYFLGDNWEVKAFTGRQKRRFDLYDPVLVGGSIDGFFMLGDTTIWTFAPGIGIVNRTLDDGNMDNLVRTLATYSPEDSIGARYNNYAFTLHNTMTVGPISWYVEAAYKTSEPVYDDLAQKTNLDGSKSLGKYVYKPGTVFYSSLAYANGGFGANFDIKRTEYFYHRVLPTQELNLGSIAFLPPMSQQNLFQLTSRYQPASQELGEMAYQLDLGYRFNDKWSAAVSMAMINNLDSIKLYREIFPTVSFEPNRNNYFTAGVQLMAANQGVFLNERADRGIVQAITPVFEYRHNINRRNAIRFELQYMKTDINWAGISEEDNDVDYGDWILLLAEYSIAPKWIFTLSDMYNINPKGRSTGANHYPTAAVTYTEGSNRFSLAYVKQVEGIVCTGGICRLEPAFSGMKFTVNSVF